jgi:hypothetical protein
MKMPIQLLAGCAPGCVCNTCIDDGLVLNIHGPSLTMSTIEGCDGGNPKTHRVANNKWPTGVERTPARGAKLGRSSGGKSGEVGVPARKSRQLVLIKIRIYALLH